MITGKTVATTREIRARTGFSEQYLGRLEREGIVSRSGRSRWLLLATIGSIIACLRDHNRRGGPGADELRHAKAQEIQSRTAEREHRLVSLDEALAVVEDIVGIVLTALAGLPARCTRDLPTRRAIEDVLYGLRLVMSDRISEQAESLRQHGKTVTTATPIVSRREISNAQTPSR